MFYAASPIPFHDQWYAEAHGVIIPYFRHLLTFKSLFVTHGDHVIAPTRGITLGLVILEGKWDCLSEMVVNCLISPFCVFPLMFWAVVRHSLRMASALCLIVGFVAGSPLLYGNILWGFQSQILLMVALSMAHLYLIVVRPGGWLRWGVAMMCGLLAAISFGSGFLVAVVSSLAMLSNWTRLRVGRGFVIATLAGCGGIVIIALWLAPTHPLMKDVQLSSVLHTFMHGLSFPARLFSYWGVLFWIPAVGALLLAVSNRGWAASLLFPLCAVVWCLSQIMVISLGRSVMAPRYYDILLVGIVANACLAIELLKYPWRFRKARLIVTGIFAIWLSAIGYKTFQSTAEHTWGDLPVFVARATQQLELVSRYYAEQHNKEVLRSSSFPTRPWPEVDFLDETLRQPEIARLWPSYILSWQSTNHLGDLPWIGQRISRASWFRGSLFVGVVAVVILCALVLRTLLEKRAGRDDMRDGNVAGAES